MLTFTSLLEMKPFTDLRYSEEGIFPSLVAILVHRYYFHTHWTQRKLGFPPHPPHFVVHQFQILLGGKNGPQSSEISLNHRLFETYAINFIAFVSL